MKFITSDGLELFYEKSGKGVPCVYLHGGPGYWSKSFQYFSEQLLEDKMEMIYLDQRGCGRSNHSQTKNYSLSRLIDDLEELRAFLGLSDWYVMGHSFGGILALNYTNRFPARTKGLILSNVTLNMFDSFGHQIEKGSELLGLEKKELHRNNIELFMETFYSIVPQLLEKEEYFQFQYIDRRNKEMVDKIDKELNTDPNFQQYVFSSKEFFQDFTLLTERVRKPVLVIAGEYDDAVGPNHHRTFKFKNSRVSVLKGSHHPYIENQWEFKEAILDFVTEAE